MPIESHVKDSDDGVLICKNSMRLRQDPPLDIQVLTVLRNAEKTIKKRKFEITPKVRFPLENDEEPLAKKPLAVVSCCTSDLEQQIIAMPWKAKSRTVQCSKEEPEAKSCKIVKVR